MQTWNELHWNWKSFVVAGVIAAFINIFASFVVGTKPAKNIIWTVWWAYLTIEAWKYWKWKALLPYPIFLLASVITIASMISVGVDYGGWTDLIVRATLNMGGLIIFYTLFRKSQKEIDRDATAPNIEKTSIEKSPHLKNQATTIQMDVFPVRTEIKNLTPNDKDQGILPSSNLEKGKDMKDRKDEDFYAQAFTEMESGNRKVGLWAKSFAEAKGNESLAKANYLKVRAEQLSNEYDQFILEQERRRQEEIRKAKAAKKLEEDRLTAVQESLLAEEYINPVLKARFSLVRSGTFMMGSPADEPGRNNNETQHQVTISKPFYMQASPVTQWQWQKVMGSNPSEFKNNGDNCPVERVSWNDVQDFIGKLNQMMGTDKNHYRLPTEAEWEYACRAGSTTAYCFGDDPGGLGEYAWYTQNSSILNDPSHLAGRLGEYRWYSVL